jgi:hypothetical protein
MPIIIKYIINILTNQNVTGNHNITNTLLYCLFLKAIKEDEDCVKGMNINELYQLFINKKYIEKYEKQYNFKMFIIDYNDFKELINLYNTYEFSYNNVLKQILDILQTKKYSLINVLINYILSLTEWNDKSILNLNIGTGDIIMSLLDNKVNINNIYGSEFDNQIKIWTLLNILIQTDKDSNNNIKQYDLLYDDLSFDKNTFDIVMCKFPHGIKNIIHANCSQAIKNLKIRGTKSEPLILQLITTLLSKNGVGIIIVPNSLLFGESKQHVETKKYLLDNFKVNKIINIDESICSNKVSILHFENTGSTKKVDFFKLNNKTGTIIEQDKITINYDKILKKNYNLFYEQYIESNEIVYNFETKKIIDVLSYINEPNYQGEEGLNGNYILIPEYFDKKVEIKFDDFVLPKNKYSIVTNNSEKYLQKYLNYCVIQLIKKNQHKLSKGKMLKFDFDSFNEYEIPIPSLKIQQILINYFDLNYKIIEKNNNQIQLYSMLKNEFINMLVSSASNIQLKNICSVDHKPIDDETIMIQKNSNTAGMVSLIKSYEKNTNTNIYFLNNINNKYTKKCLYYIIKFLENKLVNLAYLTNTINLSRMNLENFEIPDISLDIQNKICEQCEVYDKIQDNLVEINQTIIQKDIFNEISHVKK